MGTKRGDGFSIGAGGAVVDRRVNWGNLDRGYVLQGGTNQRGREVFIAAGISYSMGCLFVMSRALAIEVISGQRPRIILIALAIKIIIQRLIQRRHLLLRRILLFGLHDHFRIHC